jgi:L-aspartate oxidase
VDSVEKHVRDTLEAAQGLCDEQIVRYVIEEGPRCVEEVISWGTRFDTWNGELTFTKEGGHSEQRILHAEGDSTGKELERALIEKACSIKSIRCLENTYALDLLTRGNACFGALLFDEKKGKHIIWARKTILATGGAGRIYRETTNPEVATGDGIAMAFRAGALVRDMEFIQFHPTTLYVAGAVRALVSEAVRGEGGILLDKNGYRFMPDYHEMAELAPRDVVSRSIVNQIRSTRGNCVYLDLTHLPAERLHTRFPFITELCNGFHIDITKDRIPVRPSAHYTLGGVSVDEAGQTSMESLYACGEVTSTAFHGANRLGSNSLLEGLVFGRRVGREAGLSLAEGPPITRPLAFEAGVRSYRPAFLDIADLKNSLRSVMWRYVGIERDRSGLEYANEKLDTWARYVLEKELENPSQWELQNMLLVGKLMAAMALKREESRGVHYRTDFPERDDAGWKCHMTIGITEIGRVASAEVIGGEEQNHDKEKS